MLNLTPFYTVHNSVDVEVCTEDKTKIITINKIIMAQHRQQHKQKPISYITYFSTVNRFSTNHREPTALTNAMSTKVHTEDNTVNKENHGIKWTSIIGNPPPYSKHHAKYLVRNKFWDTTTPLYSPHQHSTTFFTE